VHVLFQPHRYTRTRDLMEEFAGAFAEADDVEVLDIYAASEEPIDGVNAQALVREMEAAGGPRVEYAASMQDGVAALALAAGEGDVVLTLGAGNVSQAGAMLLKALRS
jgi:UDP-N-acetylmuramate--alanine ligase